MTPLGLFNQDLHAAREWNKLVAQKNFSATLNDKNNLSFKDAMIQEFMVPLSPGLPDANKTTQGMQSPDGIRDDQTYTNEVNSGGTHSRLDNT